MKFLFYLLAFFAVTSVMTSCATIIGGGRYWAKVQVIDHPNAKIEYKGLTVGTGEANFMAKRFYSDKFSVTISQDGCETETKKFTQRSFRGWAFTGSMVFWTGVVVVNGTLFVPIPAGLIIDGLTGAYWKPDITEKGVYKQDHNHYKYLIDYTGCKDQPSTTKKQENMSKFDSGKLKALKELLDDGIITNEEFENVKKKILVE